MKRGRSWRRHEVKKRQFRPQEKQQQQQQLQLENYKKFSTLEECFLASPMPNSYNSNGDQALHHHVLKQNKVYPSDYASNNPRGSFSKQRLLKAGEVGSSEVEVYSSLSRSQSGKRKKKVSFRLPEEADIIVYNISEETDE